MTRAKEKAERKAKAITLAKTSLAAQSLRIDDEQKFRELFPECDVSLKFVWKEDDGKEWESDLFVSACVGTFVRKKYDLAALVAEKMITDGVDLRAHRVSKYAGYTALMHAAGLCDVSVVKIVLPHSDANATCRDGKTAAVLAREIGRNENAEYIEAFILSQAQQNTLGDEIPIPPPTPRKSIDDRRRV